MNDSARNDRSLITATSIVSSTTDTCRSAGAQQRSQLEGLLSTLANSRNRPFAVFESADLGAAKQTFQALSAPASARQPKNSLDV
ncbi:MAG TPA: hypothetical protein VIN58_00535 [Roseateles sp.]